MDADAEQLGVFMLAGLLVAALALLPAYLAHRRNERLRATGKRVRGIVVSAAFHLGRPSGYHATVCFTTQAGQVVQAEYAKNLSLRLAAGQVVWVVYEENNPSSFVLQVPVTAAFP